jgi:GNAT superfamily N-acetyltransferase
MITIEALDPSRRADFLAVLRAGRSDSSQCFCTAYHTRDWDKPGAGLACRERLFAEGRSDGFLLYEDGRPVGWCQVGPWASFGTIASKPPAVEGAWAVTCMVVVPEARRRGLGHRLLAHALEECRRRGAPAAIAMGHRLGPTYSSPLPELPESVCVKAGMALLRDDPGCPTYVLRFSPAAR